MKLLNRGEGKNLIVWVCFLQLLVNACGRKDGESTFSRALGDKNSIFKHPGWYNTRSRSTSFSKASPSPLASPRRQLDRHSLTFSTSLRGGSDNDSNNEQQAVSTPTVNLEQVPPETTTPAPLTEAELPPPPPPPTMSVLTKIRQAIFPIHGKEEVQKFLLLGSIKFFIILALTLTRDTKDTLVVTQCGAEAIAFLKVRRTMTMMIH